MRNVASFEVGFVVRDLEALMPFYTDVLGMTLVSDLYVPAQRSKPTGLSPDGYRVVRLETDRGDRFKLAQPANLPQATARSTHAFAREREAYVTFLVDDIDDVHRRLERSEARVLSDGVVEVRPGVRLLLASDPAGNFLEFVQYEDLGSYRPKG
jgi:catechol 2,3-dioxygenase-like lactoylglutathione lyase family enzyme